MSQSYLKNKYLIDIHDYGDIKRFNKGGSGAIYLVKDKKTGKEYAAKTNNIRSKSQNKLFIAREVSILIQVQHPTIIRLHGFSYVDFHNDKNTTIIMDYMKEGSLADLIFKKCKKQCPEKYNNTKRQIILIGIARGMMLLHKLHIIHRDLKPDNILLDEDLHPYITDFGLSKFFDPKNSLHQSRADTGTAPYMAPEVINGYKFNTKADVYAFGILMYEVVTGQRAYNDILTGRNGLNEFQLKKKVVDQQIRPKIKEGSMKKGFKAMIEKCWSDNKSERPTFNEIYRKLSLSKSEIYFDCESFLNKDVITVEEEDEEETVDENDEEEEFDINKTYCFDSVNYEEILNYVDQIAPDPLPLKYSSFLCTQNESSVKDEEIENLRKAVEDLKKTTKRQESTIDELESKLVNQAKMTATIDELKSKLANQAEMTSTIDELKSKLANQAEMTATIDELKSKLANQAEMTATIEQMKKKQNDMTTEINQLKQNITHLEKDLSESKSTIDEYLIEQQQVMAPLNKVSEVREEKAQAQAQKESNNKPISARFQNFQNPNGLLSAMGSSITLSAGGNMDPNQPIANIAKNNEDFFYNYKDSAGGSEFSSYILFDFGPSNVVDLYSYLIRSNQSGISCCHPKSWRIEGSNDKSSWSRLDHRLNETNLRGSLKEFNFKCQESKNGDKNNRFRYIRYVQENSWQDGFPYRIFITFFELYGDVYQC